MAVRLEGIGHCALAASNVDAMARFYQDVLGFRLLERDEGHGGVFLNLDGTSHTIDLFPAGTMQSETGTRASSLVHIAFKVGSYVALKDAHSALVAANVQIRRLLDHTNQRSIHFADPEGNGLEIYYEKPDWKAIFSEGRNDQDAVFSFDQPAPGWE